MGFGIWGTLHESAQRYGRRALAEDGQTLVEYGMLVTLIAVAVVVAAAVFGASVSSLFSVVVATM